MLLPLFEIGDISRKKHDDTTYGIELIAYILMHLFIYIIFGVIFIYTKHSFDVKQCDKYNMYPKSKMQTC